MGCKLLLVLQSAVICLTVCVMHKTSCIVQTGLVPVAMCICLLHSHLGQSTIEWADPLCDYNNNVHTKSNSGTSVSVSLLAAEVKDI
jgi:hypothetical protein